MKNRIGFVSNSSSSSFIVLKDAITGKQKDMIVNFSEWAKFFIALDEEKNYKDAKEYATEMELYQSDEYSEQSNTRLKYKFEYYDDGYWHFEETDDYIFGATTMDNFGMDEYFNYIKIDPDYVRWDEGWNDDPSQKDLEFIKNKKQRYRKYKSRLQLLVVKLGMSLTRKLVRLHYLLVQKCLFQILAKKLLLRGYLMRNQ